MAPAVLWNHAGQLDSFLQLRDVDLENMLVWAVADAAVTFQLPCSVAGRDAGEVSSALRAVVRANMWPGSCNHFIGASDTDVLSALEADGFVAASESIGSTACQLTQKGMGAIAASVCLPKPARFLEVTDAAPVAERSLYELA
eukprot:12868747-Alexandrium_andersonii.AAC.1